MNSYTVSRNDINSSLENILYYIEQKDKLNLIYSPELQIFHKEDSSTNNQFGESSKKRRKGYERANVSVKLLLRIILNNDEYKNDMYDNKV